MSHLDNAVEQFIKDTVGLGFDVTRVDGEFIDPITVKVKELWDIQHQKMQANATFIQEYLKNPILELSDGKFVARPLKGMIEYKGELVFVTSQTCLAYEMSMPISESKKLKRMVF